MNIASPSRYHRLPGVLPTPPNILLPMPLGSRWSLCSADGRAPVALPPSPSLPPPRWWLLYMAPQEYTLVPPVEAAPPAPRKLPPPASAGVTRTCPNPPAALAPVGGGWALGASAASGPSSGMIPKPPPRLLAAADIVAGLEEGEAGRNWPTARTRRVTSCKGRGGVRNWPVSNGPPPEQKLNPKTWHRVQQESTPSLGAYPRSASWKYRHYTNYRRECDSLIRPLHPPALCTGRPQPGQKSVERAGLPMRASSVSSAESRGCRR